MLTLPGSFPAQHLFDDVIRSFRPLSQASVMQWKSTEENSYAFAVLAAGLSADDIQVEQDNRMVTVRTSQPHQQRELRLSLPSDADEASLKAKLSRGVLTLEVSKNTPSVQRVVVVEE